MFENKLNFDNKINEIIDNFTNLKSDKNFKQIREAFKVIINSIKRKKKIFFCGNGGSASDSQHLVAELVGQYLKSNRKALPAISLTTNTSTITAISNDIGYNEIFSRQLEAIGNKGDVLFCISTSGKSKNIIKVLQKAKKIGLKTILLTGSRKILNKNIDFQINAPSNRVDRIQEMHIFIGHLICESIESSLFNK